MPYLAIQPFSDFCKYFLLIFANIFLFCTVSTFSLSFFANIFLPFAGSTLRFETGKDICGGHVIKPHLLRWTSWWWSWWWPQPFHLHLWAIVQILKKAITSTKLVKYHLYPIGEKLGILVVGCSYSYCSCSVTPLSKICPQNGYIPIVWWSLHEKRQVNLSLNIKGSSD